MNLKTIINGFAFLFCCSQFCLASKYLLIRLDDKQHGSSPNKKLAPYGGQQSLYQTNPFLQQGSPYNYQPQWKQNPYAQGGPKPKPYVQKPESKPRPYPMPKPEKDEPSKLNLYYKPNPEDTKPKPFSKPKPDGDEEDSMPKQYSKPKDDQPTFKPKQFTKPDDDDGEEAGYRPKKKPQSESTEAPSPYFRSLNEDVKKDQKEPDLKSHSESDFIDNGEKDKEKATTTEAATSKHLKTRSSIVNDQGEDHQEKSTIKKQEGLQSQESKEGDHEIIITATIRRSKRIDSKGPTQKDTKGGFRTAKLKDPGDENIETKTCTTNEDCISSGPCPIGLKCLSLCKKGNCKQVKIALGCRNNDDCNPGTQCIMNACVLDASGKAKQNIDKGAENQGNQEAAGKLRIGEASKIRAQNKPKKKTEQDTENREDEEGGGKFRIGEASKFKKKKDQKTIDQDTENEDGEGGGKFRLGEATKFKKKIDHDTENEDGEDNRSEKLKRGRGISGTSTSELVQDYSEKEFRKNYDILQATK